MKRKLKALGSEHRRLFRARVKKLTERPRWKRFDPAIVLENVKLWPENQRVSRNQWFFVGKAFQKAGVLEPGDWIEFEARAVKTRTGYRGPHEQFRRAYPGQTKWVLSRPSKVRKVDRTEMAGPPPVSGCGQG